MLATIQEVAKKAGVSVATVSRVINNQTTVRESTKLKVLKTIEDLNYNPNFVARNLRRTSSSMILVLLPTISNPFYAGIVKGLEDTANKNGYNILLCNTESNSSREREYLDLLQNKIADGAILLAPELDIDTLNSFAKNIPLVQCCEYQKNSNMSIVTIDNEKAAYELTTYLIELGHSKFGFISSNKNFNSAIERLSGFKKALQNSKIKFDPSLIYYGDYKYESGYEAAKRFATLPSLPTCIFSISDMMALGAINCFRDLSIDVPNDISVTGFDNIRFSRIFSPSLTTISQPRYTIGQQAMKLLIKEINKTSKETQIITCKHQLIVRQSTAKNKNNGGNY